MATKKKPDRGDMTNATFRVELSALERLAAIADAMSARAGGADVTRNAAMRAILARGLEALERELGIKPKGRR